MKPKARLLTGAIVQVFRNLVLRFFRLRTYEALICHHKVCANPFDQHTQAQTYAILLLARPLIKKIMDSTTQYLASTTLKRSLAFQIREEMMLEKNIFLYLDLNLGRFLRC